MKKQTKFEIFSITRNNRKNCIERHSGCERVCVCIYEKSFLIVVDYSVGFSFCFFFFIYLMLTNFMFLASLLPYQTFGYGNIIVVYDFSIHTFCRFCCKSSHKIVTSNCYTQTVISTDNFQVDATPECDVSVFHIFKRFFFIFLFSVSRFFLFRFQIFRCIQSGYGLEWMCRIFFFFSLLSSLVSLFFCLHLLQWTICISGI